VSGIAGSADAWGTVKPAAYSRPVATVDITELALEIGFFAGHYAVADDEREGHQHHQHLDIVERNGQADQAQEHAEVDGVAREAVGSAPDDGGGRQIGGDVRTGPGDSNDGPGGQRQRDTSNQSCRHAIAAMTEGADVYCDVDHYRG